MGSLVREERELHLAGLNDQSPIDFGHIHKFEEVTSQKFYCFTETRVIVPSRDLRRVPPHEMIVFFVFIQGTLLQDQ